MMSDETSAPAPMRAAEDWARAKGHFDKSTGLFSHWFDAASFAERWGTGREMPEAQFDDAITRVQGLALR